jgi:hypothetical protein
LLDDDEEDPAVEEELLIRAALAEAHPEDAIPAERFFAERGIPWRRVTPGE